MADYSKHNKVVALITAALADVLPWLEQINFASCTRYAAIDLETSFFFFYYHNGGSERAHIHIIWNGHLNAFIILLEGCANFPALCHSID